MIPENIKKVKSIYRSSALRSIVKWSRPAQLSVILISMIAVLSSLVSLGVTLVTKSLIDGATGGKVSALWTYGAALVALIAVSRVLSVWSSYLRTKASATLQKHMQGLVTASILGKEYASLKGYHSGELVNRVFSDVSVVKNGVITMLPTFLRTGVSFVGAAVILIAMDWRFIPVLIFAALLGSGIMIAFREPMKRRHKRMQEAEDALHASTQETLENIRVVKASVSEERAMRDMDEDREHLSSEQLRNGKLSILMNQGMSSMFDISWLICNLWGCVKIYHGAFTYGSLAALIQLIGRIQSPIANAVSLVSQAYGVVASAERLQEVIGLPDEEQGTEINSFDAIRLEGVSFHYDDGADNVLSNVNAVIRRGDFVALTGISGGGKTSLFQLLLGIYRPKSGKVLFERAGTSVPASRGTRPLFAYVPQGNTLMSGTLKDNLTMFTDSATDEDIAEAVRAACLDDIVAEIGMDAKLGERGIGLSEGQAQRVAVARALLSKAPILLLDESTSALDERTEAELLENINKMRDKTVIIVTHRRAALAICDYTLNIEGGQVTRINRSEQNSVPM
ncbi:MAG: ABC transporter ATP-binding protein [Clostridia bacterium]|nr:ABC transporter ATP-binding protein [Clostridia bacterium]